MGIVGVYIINKAGGLIFSHDVPSTVKEAEVEFAQHPVTGLTLEEVDRNVMVRYGEIKDQGDNNAVLVGYSLVAINGEAVVNKCVPDGRGVFEVINSHKSFPLKLKFRRLKTSVNERIMLLSMFHSIYAISVRLSPEEQSKGIQCVEGNTFNLYCLQTRTGVKFIVLADKWQQKVPDLLKRIYELYTDYVLKNPFYSLDMPIKCELFSSNLVKLLESVERDRYPYMPGTTTA